MKRGIGGLLGVCLLVSGARAPGAEEIGASWEWVLKGPFGGEARRLAADPRNGRRVFAGTCDGQLYLSTDGGESWRLLGSFHRPGFCISGILVDAEDSETIYVAGWSLRDQRGGGVYRSRDGGRSWVLLPGTEAHSVRALAQAPSDPRVLVFGALDGVFRSEDRGESWRRISPADDREVRNIESVAIHPRSDRVIYVGTWHLPWKTLDGGRTWTRLGGPETGILEDSEIFSILVDRREPDRMWVSACTGIYRSLDGGKRWARVRGLPSASRRVLVVARSEERPEILLAGTTEGLWRSGDGGATWSLITNRKLTVQDILILPQQKVLIATAEAGIWISHNAGMHFRPSNRGFASWVVTSVVVDREIPGRVYCGVMWGGAEGSLFLSEDGGESWRAVGRAWGTAGIRALFQSRHRGERIYALTDLGLYVSEDRGENWKRWPSPEGGLLRVVEGKDGELWGLAPEGLFRYEGDRWVLIHAAHGLKLVHVGPSGRLWVVAEGRLMMSADGARTWSEYILTQSLKNVHVLLEHPRDPDLLFAGTPLGLYRSRNGGRDWERLTQGLPQADITAIAVGVSRPEQMLVADYRMGAVYFSPDHGGTWRRIDGAAVRSRAWDVVFDPHNEGRIWVASSGTGVYMGIRRMAVAEQKKSLDF